MITIPSELAARIVSYLWSYRDEGPSEDEGWQSDELRADIAALEVAAEIHRHDHRYSSGGTCACGERRPVLGEGA